MDKSFLQWSVHHLIGHVETSTFFHLELKQLFFTPGIVSLVDSRRFRKFSIKIVEFAF